MQAAIMQVLVDALYLIALINPVSKVALLSGISSNAERREFRGVATTSSIVAGAILLGSMAFGPFLLRTVFHVELHSLRLAGGGILLWVGFNALRKGVFFEAESSARFGDMAIVPLACPLIAGPATIAACIALQAKGGLPLPAISLILALTVNDLIMRISRPVDKILTRFNILGALIRITGLIVMTIGVQMALDGLSGWVVFGNVDLPPEL